MLYRIALAQLSDNRWIVRKIAYTRVNKNRNSIDFNLADDLGPIFKNVIDAAKHAQLIVDTQMYIERADEKVEQARIHNDPMLTHLQKRANDLRVELNKLTNPLNN